ncbi:DUF2493 domain-containing protein [Methylocella sp.]|uniref:DUF2493 domain-containing protein n=1 Tax=Methylocella sp. TaxID=1978226 RepID=UPI003783151E
MRVLVCGGRTFKDAERLRRELDSLHAALGFATLIEGGADGADRLSREWAAGAGVRVEEYAPDWFAHGRAAGPVRNRQMLDEGRPDLVVAFPGGRGTANMTLQARQAGVRVIEIPA